ncbi:MAG TPA: extracellular solute-binding protein [Candidatus Limnocylindrales bacterium]|jgi:multiple sugar transport system substrate-binding protein|nr:extracellular solute-binding protein [Candidatus Limnocylindrales bacterium]
MARRLLVVSSAALLLFVACAPGASPSPTPGGGGPVTGTATLGQWESSPSERSALSSALAAFRVANPDLAVEQLTVAGNYREQMQTRFGARNPPDVFYVNAEYARDWADQGFLHPLDDYIAAAGIDTSAFFPDYLDIFKGSDGKIYGLPKDGNTIAMAYNTDLVSTPPATLEDLVAQATSLKGTGNLIAPMCLNPGLDRGLAFIYAQGGSLLNEDGTAEAITTDASKAAVQWYLDLFKDGLGMTAGDIGDGWCGEALGKGNVAFAFEGGWLYGYMNDQFPDTNWAFAEMPTGSSGEKVTISYTAAYGIGADSANKDQGWEVIEFLTSPAGMAVWTGGGIAVPSRTDVPVPQGFDVIVKGAEYSRPGSGFMKGYNAVQDAFSAAFTLEIQNGTYSADAVVNATAQAITQELGR